MGSKHSREHTQKDKTARKVRKADDDVIYAQPKAFNTKLFVLRLATVAALVLALVFGMAIFFNVKHVEVAGATKYTEWQVREASGIREGENLITLNRAQISNRILTALPYVKQVRIGIGLPDTVKIEIVEMEVVYAIEAGDGSWWLMSAEGKVVERISASEAKGFTRILGVQIYKPEIGKQAVAVEIEQTQPEDSTETVPVTVTGEERLNVVTQILKNLELNRVIGQMATVDVSNMGSLELWYAEDRYQIFLGDAERLDYKIMMLVKAINQQPEGQTGIFDASFRLDNRVSFSAIHK